MHPEIFLLIVESARKRREREREGGTRRFHYVIIYIYIYAHALLLPQRDQADDLPTWW